MFAVSVKAIVSIGKSGSCEISNDHMRSAVLINRDRFATCWPGHTLKWFISTVLGQRHCATDNLPSTEAEVVSRCVGLGVGTEVSVGVEPLGLRVNVRIVGEEPASRPSTVHRKTYGPYGRTRRWE